VGGRRGGHESEVLENPLDEEDGSSRNIVGGCGLDSFGSELEQLVASCEHSNKSSRSVKCRES
jgi:hypothetical protein